MTRLASALRLELTVQVRQKFLQAAIFSGFIWLAVLLPMPAQLRPVAEPYILLGDISIIGYFFIAGTVFFEKQERTLGAVISTPLRFGEYLAAKLTLLVLISLFVAIVVPTVADGFTYRLGCSYWGGVRNAPHAAGGLHHVAAVRLNQRLVPGSDHPTRGADAAGAALLRRVAEHVAVSHPDPGAAAAVRAAFDQVPLTPWQAVYAIGYPVGVGGGVVGGGQGDVRSLHHRKGGGTVMTTVSKAWTAFGRNDIRGTYRDPLLVMIVIAPIIWTTGVAVLTPRFTEMLAHRYQFDLVPYYPLILTAFLLLTSIVIAGGLASFLVLDEVDAGTLTALRVTPVALTTFFAYRAATVIGVTTAYVITTMAFSRILQPGLVPALIPIGLLAGLSAVVTMLLIVADG